MARTPLTRLSINHQHIAGSDLTDFVVLVACQHDGLIGAPGVVFLDEDVVLPHAVEKHDATTGELRAWVRVPKLSHEHDVSVQLCVSDEPVSASPWKGDSAFVQINGQRVVDVEAGFDHAITVEAFVDVDAARPETIQSLVAKWRLSEDLGDFAAYDASDTDGLDTTGFFGAVFDGRYVYFSPQHDRTDRHGKVLRFDTHGDFKDPDRWQGYDASETGGLNCRGYYGAVFTGRYVIFPPRRNPEGFHANVLCYDTRGAFTDPASWSAYDVGVDNSSQSAAFDGRYVYLCPGQGEEERADDTSDESSPSVTGMRPNLVGVASGNVIRYDTQGRFDAPESWTTFDTAGIDGLDTRDFDGAVYDGRFVYFAPLSFAAALRYDTTRDFHDRASWQAYDCATRFDMKRNVGAIFDGRYVYYVPYGACSVAVRFDTTADFHEHDAWQAFNLKDVPGLDVLGFDGVCFDGRFIYYIPFYDEDATFHGTLLRYDTSGDFMAPENWTCRDVSETDGLHTTAFNAAAFDGRFFYCAPWTRDSLVVGRIGGAGNVLRYDTTGSSATFDLRFCDLGHNGGLCAALPGPRFLVNTDHGPISVAANEAPKKNTRHVVGVYDGSTIRLYIDGRLVNEQSANGAINNSDVATLIGQRFDGAVLHAQVSTVARSTAWITTRYNNLRDPASFCRQQ